MPLLREDQAIILVAVDGVPLPPTFSWQSMSGGDIESASLNVRPGGIMSSISLGGPSKRNDVTVRHVYGASNGSDSFHHFLNALDTACGQTRMAVSFTPLDTDGNTQGGTLTYTGTLKSVQHPTWDANSTNAATLTLVMDADQ